MISESAKSLQTGRMDDAGLEPATSALSRRIRGGTQGNGAASKGTARREFNSAVIPARTPLAPLLPRLVYAPCTRDLLRLISWPARVLVEAWWLAGRARALASVPLIDGRAEW